MLELSDSENYTITIVEIVIFMIMNTITIVDLLNISIQTWPKFLNYYKSSQFYTCRLHFILFQEIFAGKSAHISYKFTIQKVR